MPPIEDLTLYDDAESDLLAWPGDTRGRTVNLRMTPGRARLLARDLELHMPLNSLWLALAEPLRQAARQ